MKKLLLLFVSVLLFLACNSSDDSSLNFNSDIRVNGVVFTPTNARVSNATANMPGEGAMAFSFTKGTSGSSGYEAVNFTINYPLTSSSAPNGVYEFGIGVIGEVLFAQGFYVKGSTAYDMAGYSVQVTALSNNEYRIDFQNIQAFNPLNSQVVIISGYYEGEIN
ncbi:MAG: hypothetical protein Q8K02_16710 [Flavobacterium sp.]|nr:hypothetical protein [Flavobacterium sp.]